MVNQKGSAEARLSGSFFPNGKKGLVEVIFWVVIMIIILLVAYKFLSSFLGTTPELQAFGNFKETVETVCATGGPTAIGTSLYLPKTENTPGNFEYIRLHMAGSQVEVYKCSNIGGTGCNDASKIKSKVLNCPNDITIANCWVDAPTESVQVTIMKDVLAKTVSLNKTAGVYC